MIEKSGLIFWCILCLFFASPSWSELLKPIGFPRARLAIKTQATLRESYSIDESKVSLPKGKTVEIVRSEGDRYLCLLPDDRCVWLSGGSVRILRTGKEKRWQLRTLFHRLGKKNNKKLPSWLSYKTVRTNSLSLHLVTGELSSAPTPCLSPIVSKNFDTRAKGHKKNWRHRWLPMKGMGFLASTPLAISGTFIATNPEDLGSPLGPITHHQELVHDSNDLFRRPPARAYLAETDGGRMVIANGPKSAKTLLGLQKNGQLLSNQLEPGEKIQSLIGGFGLLAQKGNPAVWRQYVDKQFQPSYYGGFARRAQLLLGVDKEKLRFFILFQEGRPRSRLPLTLPQLTLVLVGCGASEVAFADGGDSSRMWLYGQLVTPLTLKGSRRRLSNVISFGRPHGR